MRLIGWTGVAVIRIRDLGTLEMRLVLRGHELYVHGLAFTPDGRTLVSASGDRTIRVWSADR